MERKFPAKSLEDLVFGVIIGHIWGLWFAPKVTVKKYRVN
jgi:hypothetical protein